MKWLDHDILMIPGPSEPYQEAICALSKPVKHHYGSRWKGIYDNTCDDLKKIFKTQADVILVPACGTAGIELAVTNLIEPGDKAILVHDGYFAEVFEELITSCEGHPLLASADYGEAVKPESIRRILEKERNVKAIFTVYNDTITGIKHSLPEIGDIANEFGLLNVVDAISAFGGMELQMDSWNIDICIGYPSKALGGINGVTPVALSQKIWECVSQRKPPVRTRFLNLKVWRKCIDDWSSWGHPYPTSMPTSVIQALAKCVDMALKEGLGNRYARHKICKKALREGIRSLGLENFVKEENASETLTTVGLPDRLKSSMIIAHMQDDFNIIIGSMNMLGINGLRIAHMGSTASPHYILPTLFALEATLSKLGWPVDKGEAIKTAAKCFHEQL